MVCKPTSCTDGVVNGDETDLDCGGPCRRCDAGSAVQCNAGLRFGCVPGQPLRLGQLHRPPPQRRQDRSRLRRLLWSVHRRQRLRYSAPAWTDGSFLNPGDLTTGPGNAKYPSFVFLPVERLRGELEGHPYAISFPTTTALQIFRGPAVIVNGHPDFNTGAPNWSTQPNCQTFGCNINFVFPLTRFGWSANQEMIA